MHYHDVELILRRLDRIADALDRLAPKVEEEKLPPGSQTLAEEYPNIPGNVLNTQVGGYIGLDRVFQQPPRLHHPAVGRIL